MEKISQEDIDKFIREREEQQMEFRHLDKKVTEYKQQIKAGTFSLNFQWEMDITKIDLGLLKTDLIDDIKNNLERDFVIVSLNLDMVISKYCINPDRTYPKDKLWVIRQPHTIARLIEFIKNNNTIIPPIIHSTNNNCLSIIDGNHRIALCRFMKLTKIPFLIKKDDLQFIKDLH